MVSPVDEIQRGAAGRRRLIYVLCGAVVIACVLAVLLLAGSGGDGPAPAPRTAGGGPSPRPEEQTPTEAPAPGTEEPAAAPGTSPPSDAFREARSEADGFEDAMAKVRTSMEAAPGSEEQTAAFRAALDGLVAAQEAYETIVLDFPDSESRLERRLSELQSQLYWCRKSMPATAFGDTSGGGREGWPEPPPATREPEPRPGTRPPRAIPAFRPEQAARRFSHRATAAFRQGRPDLVLEAGEPLIADERMHAHLGDIPSKVELAGRFVALLESARRSLRSRRGETLDLEFRDGAASGVLGEDGEELVLEGPEPRRFRPSDLAPAGLLELWEPASVLASPEGLRDAGAYLLLRGDLADGVRLLLRARAEGTDVSAFEKPFSDALGRNPELLAFSAWLELRPLLATKAPDVCGAVLQYKDSHGGTACFAEHREELFAAYAAAAGSQTFDLADLYEGAAKITGRSIRLEYGFDRPEELLDFGQAGGEWQIEDGTLTSTKGYAWIERFDLASADLRFVLPEPVEVIAGFWGADRRGRGGINLLLKPDAAGLQVRLLRGDRPFAVETISMPTGPVEVVLSRRDDKFQVRVGRRVVLKGESRGDLDALHAVGFAARGGRIAIEEVELKTDLDLDWAKAGGNRFAAWIGEWYVARGAPVEDRKKPEKTLLAEGWPEPDGFDPALTGEDGKPVWVQVSGVGTGLDLNRYVRPHDWTTGYAAIRIWSPKRRNALLEVAADDMARAWLNGEQAVEIVRLGTTARIPVKLEKGDNLLLVKVVETWGGFWLRARLLDKSGDLLPDLVCW